ncbi:hypothetical protein HDU76_010704 [Blyttiomyces sp. JEL0837]|nr:hypothetical protein HDU76_010704 [Blyttiomyces sp. JEL0837]
MLFGRHMILATATVALVLVTASVAEPPTPSQTISSGPAPLFASPAAPNSLTNPTLQQTRNENVEVSQEHVRNPPQHDEHMHLHHHEHQHHHMHHHCDNCDMSERTDNNDISPAAPPNTEPSEPNETPNPSQQVTEPISAIPPSPSLSPATFAAYLVEVNRGPTLGMLTRPGTMLIHLDREFEGISMNLRANDIVGGRDGITAVIVDATISPSPSTNPTTQTPSIEYSDNVLAHGADSTFALNLHNILNSTGIVIPPGNNEIKLTMNLSFQVRRQVCMQDLNYLIGTRGTRVGRRRSERLLRDLVMERGGCGRRVSVDGFRVLMDGVGYVHAL